MGDFLHNTLGRLGLPAGGMMLIIGGLLVVGIIVLLLVGAYMLGCMVGYEDGTKRRQG